MDRKIGKSLMILAALVMLLVVVWLLLPAPPSAPLKPMPHPNGYAKLLEATRTVDGDTSRYPEMNREELQHLVESCTNALQLARTGLRQECRVPFPSSQAQLESHVKELGGFKGLAAALTAEGRLAELEDRHGAAAKCYLDVIHLGTEAGRGGPLIDELVDIAIEGIGTRHLQGLTGRLDAKICRETAVALESIDAQRQTWTEVERQEREWSRRAHPGLQYRLAALVNRRSLRQAEAKGEQRFNDNVAHTRRLILDLAARAYELEKGQPPKAAADLVPEYLKAVPQDPATGTNLVCSP